MYVPMTDACSVPNSTSPVSPDFLAAVQKRATGVDQIFTSAQSAFDAIINRTDLNTNGFPLVTHGGTPAGPVGSAAGQSTVGGKITSLKNWPVNSNGRPACIVTKPLPQSVQIDTRIAYAAPVAPPSPPLTTQARADAAVPANVPIPSTGNPCIDNALGYLSASQWSEAWAQKCALKNYGLIGKRTPDPAVLQAIHAADVAGKLSQIPLTDVPDFTRELAAQYGVNISGLGDASTDFSFGWAGVGLFAAGVYLAYEYWKTPRRRR